MDVDYDFESDDSFFEDPKSSKPSSKVGEKKKSLEELFGFQNEPLDKKNPVDAVQSKPKVRFDLDDTSEPPKVDSSKRKPVDWLGDLDDSKSKQEDTISKTDNKKSFDILDDILPQKSRRTEQSKTTSFDDILRESKTKKLPIASSLDTVKEPLKTSFENTTKSTAEDLNMILAPSSQGRRGRRGSNAGVTDVLGLFEGSSSLTKAEDKPVNPVTKPSPKEVPDWLAGSSTTVGNKSDTTISVTRSVESEPQADAIKVASSLLETTTKSSEPSTSSFQKNMSNLQTQESFLLVSLQLKKHEENLSEIKNQQQEILKKQESQFEVFLNKYIENQRGIEQEMLAQQERINEHIRMMALKGFEGGQVPKASKEEENVEKENDGNLERIIANLKQRHQEEFFLMEESYKKQIQLLEKSSESMEQRLNEDIENATKRHEQKLIDLHRQHEEEIQHWTEKMKNLEEQHRKDVEILKENYNRAVRDAKDDFLDQLERIKEQKMSESDLFTNSKDLTLKLNSNLEKLEKNEGILERLQDKVVKDYDVLSHTRERSIENKEKEVAAMRVALDKCREQAENDRSQLLALVKTLEQKISEQNHNSQEERWALQQTAATLAARSVAFDREVEFSRASIERERQQLKTLKETVLAEQEKATLELTEEKLKFSAEKTRAEVASKLLNTFEVDKMKAEAESAIEVAKELTEKLNVERNFLQRQKIELDSLRNKLIEKERDLIAREDNFEEMKQHFERKTNENIRTAKEVKHLENKYKEKLQELQIQAASLVSREKKLAEEKLALSRERLSTYSTMRSQRKCMLCQAEEDKVKNVNYFPIPPTDFEMIKFGIEAMEEDRNSEVSKEERTPN
ncbi:hypothetical protein ABEB36_000817 [Hypothenemus hampei]|uniref:Fas-binding factor 1 C-terminal domain-containing protein n=1 Tax=Hypothenemus hampei TaxID=57062 RepID=A0ABD1FCI1_HYPHA